MCTVQAMLTNVLAHLEMADLLGFLLLLLCIFLGGLFVTLHVRSWHNFKVSVVSERSREILRPAHSDKQACRYHFKVM